MIQAQIVFHNDRYREIRVQGHADWAAHGEDLVCAAVSVLTLTLANTLEELAENHYDLRIEHGDFTLVLKDEATDRSRVAIRSFEIGMEGLERTYPDYVKIKRRMT
ncbi:MAG: ribosomal-processing cysteine protease Prp [Bacillota bacterium]|nr:ribosomal-processing cysteine protease Prp [Bacillota bacterium]